MQQFPLVAVGASAGGLAALRRLFTHVPANSGHAFVIVMHLSPEHESHLTELLQPSIKMPVRQIAGTTKLEPDHVYVIPPNANLDTIDTHLRLSELEPRRNERAPIDHFFRTLAATHGRNAIGIVLSGTGTDGTLGLRAIKEAGGLTIAQDPAEAEYDGMPRSAIANAPVDLVLPVATIPEAFMHYSRTTPRLELPAPGTEESETATRQFLHRVFGHVRARTGRDFSQYKRSTMLRRISRRMQFNQIQEPNDYLELLRARPDEIHALADDLLITVTNFFRDPQVFDALAAHVIPALFAAKQPTDTVRTWTVGCATGEEAYSVAMLLIEEAERHATPPAIQVFATDLHPHSLVKAREGFYAGHIEADVRPDRLQRFFEAEDGGYRIRKEVREAVIFAPHNILSDPPFSRVDLITCRNLLIYLNRDLHQQVAELFHYALRPDGVLVLGTSENIDAAELFRIEDKTNGLYRKRNIPGPEPRLPVFPLTQGRVVGERPQTTTVKEPIVYSTLHQRMLEEHGPATVLVSPDDNVVHSSGKAGRYLVLPGGPPTTNVYKLARDGLRSELRSAIAEARRDRKAVRPKPVPVQVDRTPVTIALEAQPGDDDEGYVLVIFTELAAREPASGQAAGLGDSNAVEPTPAELVRIETERRQLEQRLQHVLEDHETSQEELRASNEELQSANEELRSTLEELETSKEELQSINEELQSLNQESRNRMEELDQLSADLQNLLVATDIATLFLDRDLHIVRFTPRVEELFSIRASDKGRPLSDLTTRLGYPTLATDARKVLDRLTPIEREVQDLHGHWYLARVLPYRSHVDRIAGVVVTFVDITRLKQAEYAQQIIESLPEPLLVLHSDLRVRFANAAFYEQFKVDRNATEGVLVYQLGNGQWDIPELRHLLEHVLPDDQRFANYQVEHVFESVGRRVMLLNARRLEQMQLVLLGIHDITARSNT